MKTPLLVAALLLVGIGVFGFYQGWFHLSTNSTDANPSATFTVDKDKIQADGEAAKDTVQGLGQDVKEETGDLTEKVKQ